MGSESLAQARPLGHECQPALPADEVTPTPDPPRLSVPSPGLVRNFGALFGGQLVTWAMTMLWTLVVPRLLGPRSFGIIVTGLSVSGIFGVFCGLANRNYLVREIVMNRASAAKIVGTALVLRLMFTPLMAAGALIFARLAYHTHEQAVVLYLAVAFSSATLLYEPLQSAFQAIEQMKYLAFADVINKSAQSVIGIAIAALGLGAIGITANMAVFAIAVLALTVVWLRRYLPPIDLRTNAHLIKTMARRSVGYWAFGFFYTVYLWIDTVMLSLLTDSKVVGWYGASITLFQTVMFLPSLMGTTWLPRFVGAFNDSPRQLLRAARTPVEFVLVVSAPIAAATAMAAPTIIHVLYGSAYAHAVPVLVILAITIPPTYFNTFLNPILVAAGRKKLITAFMVGSTIVNPALNLVLIPYTQTRYHNGAVGAALALLLTELIQMLVAMIIVGRHTLDRRAVVRCGLAFGASGAMWTTAWLLHPVGEVVSLTAGAGTLLLLAALWRIPTAEEVRFVRAALFRLTNRPSTQRPK